MSSHDLDARIDAIEAAYEYMLAYAAQGVSGDPESQTGGELRHHLGRLAAALAGLGPAVAAAGPDAPEYLAFRDIVDQDARRAHATIRLVLAQPAISSQLIDNLNASMHLRTLLTDLFLLDEILAPSSRELPS